MNVKVIEFPRDRYTWNDEFFEIAFPATVDRRQVKCRVTMEALSVHFGADGSNYEQAFALNITAINGITRRKIMAEDYLENGDILVSSADVA